MFTGAVVAARRNGFSPPASLPGQVQGSSLSHSLMHSAGRSKGSRRGRMVDFNSGLWNLLGKLSVNDFDLESNGLENNFRQYYKGTRKKFTVPEVESGHGGGDPIIEGEPSDYQNEYNPSDLSREGSTNLYDFQYEPQEAMPLFNDYHSPTYDIQIPTHFVKGTENDQRFAEPAYHQEFFYPTEQTSVVFINAPFTHTSDVSGSQLPENVDYKIPSDDNWVSIKNSHEQVQTQSGNYGQYFSTSEIPMKFATSTSPIQEETSPTQEPAYDGIISNYEEQTTIPIFSTTQEYFSTKPNSLFETTTYSELDDENRRTAAEVTDDDLKFVYSQSISPETPNPIETVPNKFNSHSNKIIAEIPPEVVNLVTGFLDQNLNNVDADSLQIVFHRLKNLFAYAENVVSNEKVNLKMNKPSIKVPPQQSQILNITDPSKQVIIVYRPVVFVNQPVGSNGTFVLGHGYRPTILSGDEGATITKEVLDNISPDFLNNVAEKFVEQVNILAESDASGLKIEKVKKPSNDNNIETYVVFDEKEKNVHKHADKIEVDFIGERVPSSVDTKTSSVDIKIKPSFASFEIPLQNHILQSSTSEINFNTKNSLSDLIQHATESGTAPTLTSLSVPSVETLFENLPNQSSYVESTSPESENTESANEGVLNTTEGIEATELPGTTTHSEDEQISTTFGILDGMNYQETTFLPDSEYVPEDYVPTTTGFMDSQYLENSDLPMENPIQTSDFNNQGYEILLSTTEQISLQPTIGEDTLSTTEEALNLDPEGVNNIALRVQIVPAEKFPEYQHVMKEHIIHMRPTSYPSSQANQDFPSPIADDPGEIPTSEAATAIETSFATTASKIPVETISDIDTSAMSPNTDTDEDGLVPIQYGNNIIFTNDPEVHLEHFGHQTPFPISNLESLNPGMWWISKPDESNRKYVIRRIVKRRKNESSALRRKVFRRKPVRNGEEFQKPENVVTLKAEAEVFSDPTFLPAANTAEFLPVPSSTDITMTTITTQTTFPSTSTTEHTSKPPSTIDVIIPLVSVTQTSTKPTISTTTANYAALPIPSTTQTSLQTSESPNSTISAPAFHETEQGNDSQVVFNDDDVRLNHETAELNSADTHQDSEDQPVQSTGDASDFSSSIQDKVQQLVTESEKNPGSLIRNLAQLIQKLYERRKFFF